MFMREKKTLDRSQLDDVPIKGYIMDVGLKIPILNTLNIERPKFNYKIQFRREGGGHGPSIFLPNLFFVFRVRVFFISITPTMGPLYYNLRFATD